MSSEPSALTWCCFNLFCWPLRLYMTKRTRGCTRGSRSHVPRKPPRPLPPREHRLSFTDEKVPGTIGLRMVTSDQSQSHFFSLLPKEIRLQIYEYILGGRLLHIGLVERDPERAPYLRRYPCLLENDVSNWDHCCWHSSSTPAEKLLPLLQSCRLVYNEAISILYSANTFSFHDSELLQYFPTLVPRQRFEAIRSLKLYFHLWDFPSEHPPAREHCDEIWRLLASMPRLRELRVKLEMRDGRMLIFTDITYWRLNEAAWLAPLKSIKGLEVFELELPLVPASKISKDIDVGECRIHALGETWEE